MNLLELKEKVDQAIDDAINHYKDDPKTIQVSIQIDDMSGESVCSSDLELYYDNDCQASGCVLVGQIDQDDEVDFDSMKSLTCTCKSTTNGLHYGACPSKTGIPK